MVKSKPRTFEGKYFKVREDYVFVPGNSFHSIEDGVQFDSYLQYRSPSEETAKQYLTTLVELCEWADAVRDDDSCLSYNGFIESEDDASSFADELERVIGILGEDCIDYFESLKEGLGVFETAMDRVPHSKWALDEATCGDWFYSVGWPTANHLKS